MTMSLNALDLSQDDKIMHIGVSVITGMAGNAFCYQELGFTEVQSWWCGIGTALVIGGMKEWYDSNHGGRFDWEDMAANGVGGTIGTSFLYYRYEF